MYRPRSLLVYAAVTLTMSGCVGDSVEPADLVVRGGKIVTVDAIGTEVEALAARDGRIVALGLSADVDQYVGAGTEVIELAGATAYPGFIEAHGHYMGVGQSTLQLDLMDVESWDEIVNMVAEAARNAAPGELIVGRGWHQEKWTTRPDPQVDGLPHHDGLSEVSPGNPVILTHASGHATFANARAMEMSGITADTENPSGGEIVRDAAGEPIGAFRETASALLGPARRAANPSEPRRVALLAQEEAFSKGLTSFQDAGVGFQTVDLYKQMVDGDALKIRLWVMIRADNDDMAENLAAYRMIGYGNDRLTVRGIKKSIDGALGSHGAWLLEPYADLPSSAGLNTTSIEDIEEASRLALEHGYQMCVHAIGDRANRETLDIFEAAYERSGQDDLRWRIEHAQHLHPDDIPRFGELGVIASMQGVHATSDGPWVEAKLGARRTSEGAYVWRKLMETGAVIANGTDAPVENVDPIASYYATISRMMNTGERFLPGERMDRIEALRSYTINAAFAAFEDDIKGSLEIGKLADLTILDTDLLTAEEEAVAGAQVVATVVGGEVVYRSSR